jgi:putative phage-type endonuclease
MQDYKLYYFEQRSPEWYKIREGKITASHIVNILGLITLAKTKDAIDNLAMKLAIESVYGMIEDNFVNFEMQRGIDNEPLAFDKLSEYLASDFIELNKIGFAEYNKHIGASPDGKASNNYNVETKCPNVGNYFKYVLTGEIDPKHYAQMQHQMMCTNTDATYYVNYCIHNAKEYCTIKVVNRDEKMIELIKTRCDLVIDSKLKYIDILNNTKQLNLIP